MKTIIPESINTQDLRSFFGSKASLCKGITLRMIDQLIEKRGNDWHMLFIDNKWDDIANYLQLNNEKKLLLQEEWNKSYGYFTLYNAFTPYNVSSFSIKKLFKLYGVKAITTIKQNPYVCMEEVGIGFKTADKIASDFGITSNDRKRITAAIMFILEQQKESGHTFVFDTVFNEHIILLLGNNVDTTTINECILDLHKKKIIKKFYIEDQWAYCIYHTWMCEIEIAEKLKNHQSTTPKKITLEALDPSLSQEQKVAVEGALKNNISIITGGPGTGKTKIIKTIYDIASKNHLKILLLAPTGRAAQRIEETVGASASTIHRALGFKKMFLASKKQIDSFRPLLYDIIIIDESSMIDVFMMYAYIKSISSKTQLIFVGDVNQLPSVGCGNILYDMIQSEVIPVFKLNKIFRQKEHATLLPIAHDVCNQLIPKISYNSDYDCYFKPTEKQDFQKTIEALIEQWYDKKSGAILIQFITAMNRGTSGSYAMNKIIQKWRADTLKLTTKNQTLGFFFIGDRVMQTVNNYELEVFNGDIGIVIEGTSQHCVVKFTDKQCTYDRSNVYQLTLAYAITIHKSQGSEFPVVCIPVFMEQYILLNKQIVYTAITRAKEKCIILGEFKALCCGIKKQEGERTTLLEYFLRS
jgi:exodeoxyribonuclease V alpha subunit